MEDSKVNFKRELDALTTIRDELKLKAHLAKAEIKDELSQLESRWRGLETELQRSAAHMKEPLETLNEGTKQLLKELKAGYEKLRGRLD